MCALKVSNTAGLIIFQPFMVFGHLFTSSRDFSLTTFIMFIGQLNIEDNKNSSKNNPIDKHRQNLENGSRLSKNEIAIYGWYPKGILHKKINRVFPVCHYSKVAWILFRIAAPLTLFCGSSIGLRLLYVSELRDEVVIAETNAWRMWKC